MKKKLRLALLLAGGALVFLWLIKAPLMASYMTQKMGVPVSVGTITMRPSRTLIRDFKVKNPRGFKTPNAFKAKKTLITYSFENLWKEPREIDEIDIEHIFLSIDFKDRSGQVNNWGTIANGMPQQKHRSREVIIHKLILTDIDVVIEGISPSKESQKQHIARIELDEINSKEGFPTRELVSQLLDSAGLGQYLENALRPDKVIEGALDPFSEFD